MAARDRASTSRIHSALFGLSTDPLLPVPAMGELVDRPPIEHPWSKAAQPTPRAHALRCPCRHAGLAATVATALHRNSQSRPGGTSLQSDQSWWQTSPAPGGILAVRARTCACEAVSHATMLAGLVCNCSLALSCPEGLQLPHGRQSPTDWKALPKHDKTPQQRKASAKRGACYCGGPSCC